VSLKALTIAVCLVIAGLHASVADASPTMIRLGYSTCTSCHISPQGAGLLTPYGKGIDEAQSLRAREMPAGEAPDPRLAFDVRVVGASQGTRLLEQSSGMTAASRFSAMMRSSLRLSKSNRLTYVMGVETPLIQSTPKTPITGKMVIPTALWEYRPKEGVEIAVGRDVMPSGIGLPDPQTFIRNGTDARDARFPTQIKAFLWNERFQVTPYLFAPGGDEPREAQQYGGGVLGGVDLWQHHAVLGLSTRIASGTTSDRHSVGAFARLGFGKWGILAEHDLTARDPIGSAADAADTRHLAGHTQVFFAAKEWLVTSLAAEHLVIDGLARPTHTYRITPSVQARLTQNVTVIVNMRDVFTDARSARSRTFAAQVAVKSVQ
jgi:hypothetical protein